MSLNYQLPSGRLWWRCRFADGAHVSEMVFSNEKAPTWFYANQLAQILLRESGFEKLPEYKVVLFEPKRPRIPDGVYGTKTLAAITMFQKRHK